MSDIETVEGCVCLAPESDSDVEMCREADFGTPTLRCTRPDGHDGQHVACGSVQPYDDDPDGHWYSVWGDD